LFGRRSCLVTFPLTPALTSVRGGKFTSWVKNGLRRLHSEVVTLTGECELKYGNIIDRHLFTRMRFTM